MINKYTGELLKMASLIQTSLQNMSVAADGSPANATLLMPKLQFRFRLTFVNFGLAGEDSLILTRQVMDCSRPNVTFDEVTLNMYNSTMYLAGKHKWQTLSVNIRDDAGGGVSKLIGQQLQKQLNFAEQASAAAGVDYKFQLNMQVLDGGNGTAVPGVLETWQLGGCFIQAANYNTLNYATSDQVSIALTIRYDNALQTDAQGSSATGVGYTIGRTVGSLATP